MSSSPTVLDQVVIPLIRGKTVLDVGCGYGRWASLIHSNYWEAGLSKPPIVDGLDAFLPNVRFCSKMHCYRKVWLQKMPSEIKGKWDVVLAAEVLEHIPQRDVEKTLDVLESAAKKRVIISTPNWPAYRSGSETKVGYNKYEAHLSYVSRRYLKKRGYKVIGVGFANPNFWLFRLLRVFIGSKKSGKTQKDGETKINKRRAFDSLPILFPSLGYAIVAYKDITERR